MRRARAILYVGLAALLLVVSGVVATSAMQATSVHPSGGAQDGQNAGPTYNVTFSETGLPPGTNWTVWVGSLWASWPWHPGGFQPSWTVSNWGGTNWHQGQFQSSTGPSMNFSLPNGTYFYNARPPAGYTTSDGQGIFNVSGASPPAISITFSPLVTYAVTFSETGLPAGTNWTVTVFHGWGEWMSPGDFRFHSETSDTSTITFQLSNGTYFYRISGIVGFAANESWGFFEVVGASPAAITVTFSPVATYTVAFNESGLPTGTNWSVWVFGEQSGGGGFVFTHATSSTANISFSLANGTYFYQIGRVAGYQVTPGEQFGTFNVTGASPPEISVVFTSSDPS